MKRFILSALALAAMLGAAYLLLREPAHVACAYEECL